MYYAVNSVPLPNTEKTKELYLPGGADWNDLWTNALYTGGQTIKCPAAIDTIPAFVKAGSIIPISDALMFADQKKGETSEIQIYSGSDGEFNLYNGDGDNYSFENGNYSIIRLTYQDGDKTLKCGKASGNFKYQENFRIRLIEDKRSAKITDFLYRGKEKNVCLGEIKKGIINK